MGDEYKLPVSSYEELVKVIKAYGNLKQDSPATLDDVVGVSGISKTIISKNNGFLIQIGLISKGTKKAPTDTCKKLASAYNANINEEVVKIWQEIVSDDPLFQKIISIIQVKGSLNKGDYINHIVYTSGMKLSATAKTGAATMIDLLKITKVIMENEGMITLAQNINNLNGNRDNNANTENQINEFNAKPVDSDYYIQQYTCESGAVAKIIIPNNASEDDLLGFRDMLDIVLRRKFKLKN